MNKVLRHALVLVGTALVSMSCGGERIAESDSTNQSEATVRVDAESVETETTAQVNPASLNQRAASSTQPLPVPNLIPPTTPGDRLPTVTVGRSEPFSAIADAPIVRRRASVATVPSNPEPLAVVAPAPQITTVPLPNQPLPVLPSGSTPTVAPGTTATANPPNGAASISPTNVANAVEINGVVQVGGQVSAIVQVPGEPTSRYVNAGDYLASGSVFVKRIEVGEEPVVILEQNGIEVIRSVGSSAIAGALQ